MLWYIVSLFTIMWCFYIWFLEAEIILNDNHAFNNRRKVVGLSSYSMYKSERYVVTGTIGYRVVITDLHEDLSYVLQHSNLAKFRSVFPYLSKKDETLRDDFITACIAPLTGRKHAA